MVYTYFEIGRKIVEDEQQGQQRTEYGKQVLKELSAKLTKEFGKGFRLKISIECVFFTKHTLLKVRQHR